MNTARLTVLVRGSAGDYSCCCGMRFQTPQSLAGHCNSCAVHRATNVPVRKRREEAEAECGTTTKKKTKGYACAECGKRFETSQSKAGDAHSCEQRRKDACRALEILSMVGSEEDVIERLRERLDIAETAYYRVCAENELLKKQLMLVVK